MPPVKHIGSRDNPLLVRLRKLIADPAGYRKAGTVWIEGEHLCSAYLTHGGQASQALISDAAWDVAGPRAIASAAASVAVVPQALMRSLSSLESPGSLTLGLLIPWEGAAELRPDAPSVVLDRLQDAGNAGTVLRSAAAFGFEQVLACKGTAALWSPKVLRAGMGAHFGLNLVEGLDAAALAALRMPMLATSSHADTALHQTELPWPCAWILGNEGQGVSAALLQRATLRLRIPQPGGEESLNVAAAAAVCFYESARQRGFAGA